MMVAIALNEAQSQAVIPAKFEDARGLMIVETDGFEIKEYVTSAWMDKMVEWDCELVLCGEMYDAKLFESIARKGISRYLAAGMTAKRAVGEMLDDRLELIRDYCGGPGCGSHEKECDDECDSCEAGCDV
jgi:predicted Fe-Mo cluster-binding NifX family protein